MNPSSNAPSGRWYEVFFLIRFILTILQGSRLFRSRHSLVVWVSVTQLLTLSTPANICSMTMYYFWAIVVSIGLCTRLVSLIRGIQRQEWLPVPESESNLERHSDINDYGIFSLPYVFLKRYIFIPATFGYRCSQSVQWCTIPPRIQSITIASFVLLNIVLCSISYEVFEDNIFWPNVSTQMWRYISDRTGIISLANFPIIWLFGTRNNTLMWLTGWGFGAYNNFHRWVARVATVQAVVHSIGYTEMVLERE